MIRPNSKIMNEYKIVVVFYFAKTMYVRRFSNMWKKF